jgi:hypothetical protein
MVSTPGNKRFSLLYGVYTETGAHTDTYAVASGDCFLGNKKLQGRKPHHSPTSSSEVKKSETIPPL